MERTGHLTSAFNESMLKKKEQTETDSLNIMPLKTASF